MLTKRLEEGTFPWPKHLEPQTTKLKLIPQALVMLTDDVDLRGGKTASVYEREERKNNLKSLNVLFGASEFAIDDAARAG